MDVALSAKAAIEWVATEAELDGIKGLGPSSTARILAARQKGAFKDWNDVIRRVSGVRAASAAKLSAAGLVVNGLPYASAGDAALRIVPSPPLGTPSSWWFRSPTANGGGAARWCPARSSKQQLNLACRSPTLSTTYSTQLLNSVSSLRLGA